MRNRREPLSIALEKMVRKLLPRLRAVGQAGAMKRKFLRGTDGLPRSPEHGVRGERLVVQLLQNNGRRVRLLPQRTSPANLAPGRADAPVTAVSGILGVGAGTSSAGVCRCVWRILCSSAGERLDAILVTCPPPF